MYKSIDILITSAGKKFGKQWIFRKVNLEILGGQKIAILGLNGSGKSTLLQAITTYLSLNEGRVTYYSDNKIIEAENIYKVISLASPYLELIDDFTLREMIEHTFSFKPFINKLTLNNVIEISGLGNHSHKKINDFSSGMKQRLKLTLAILADTPVLFLDEPTTNLDAVVTNWYKEMILKYAMHKTIIVCSNSIAEEYYFCDTILDMENFKS